MRVIVIVLVMLAAPLAHAESEAERLYNQGQQAYEALRYDDALTAWEKSYALSKLPALVFNIAQAQRVRGRPGDCTKATASYRRFIALAPKSNERPQAEGFIAELAPCVEQEAKPQPAAPVVPPPTAVMPPAMTGTPPAQQPMPISEGNPGRGKRFAGYAVGGAGVVLALTGVYFGAKARRLGDEVSDECRDGCDWNLVKDKDAEGKSAETTQYILYGVGAAAIVAGGVLWWMGNSEAKRSNVAVTPTHGGAAVSWSGAW
jgi:tetratricopeptide (TPR) repeat protein